MHSFTTVNSPYRKVRHLGKGARPHDHGNHDRAFEINDEITPGIHSEAITKQLEEIFEKDLKACVELDSATWAKRGFWHRMKDHAYYTINGHL